jgi:hypothetical protein
VPAPPGGAREVLNKMRLLTGDETGLVKAISVEDKKVGNPSISFQYNYSVA